MIIMGLINLEYAVFALLLGIGIFGYVAYAKPEVNWGSAFESRAKWKANQSVLQLNQYKLSNVKNFQPSFLVLCKRPTPPIKYNLVIPSNFNVVIDNNPVAVAEDEGVIDWNDKKYLQTESIINFTRTLRRGFGTIVYCHVLIGKLDNLFEHVSDPNKKYYLEFNKIRQGAPSNNPDYRSSRSIFHFKSYKLFESKLANDALKPAFYEEIGSDNVRNGARILMQTCGIGKLTTNTIVIGFKQNWSNLSLKEAAADDDNKERDSSEDESLSSTLSNDDYVGLLMDSLKMRMGFMVCRGFEKIEWHKQTVVNPNATSKPVSPRGMFCLLCCCVNHC